MPKREKVSPRKLYEAPVFTVYGTVHHITKSTGFRQTPDGGPMPNNTSGGTGGG